MVEKSPLPKIHVILRSLVELQYKAFTPSAVGSQIMCTLFCSIRNRQKNNVVLVHTVGTRETVRSSLHSLHLKNVAGASSKNGTSTHVRTSLDTSP